MQQLFLMLVLARVCAFFRCQAPALKAPAPQTLPSPFASLQRHAVRSACLVVCTATCGCAPSQPDAGSEGTVVVFPHPHSATLVWDGGSVIAGEPLQAALTVENRGRKRLVLNRPAAECNCRAPLAQTWIVPVGARRMVHWPIVTQDRHGKLRVRVEFTTSDPACPRLTLLWQGVVTAADPEAAQPFVVP